MMRLLLAGLALAVAEANMYDVLEPAKLPPLACAQGCARWEALKADGYTGPTTQAAADALWVEGTPPAGAAGSCAMPGKAAVSSQNVVQGALGSWCFCKNSSASGYCTAGKGVPEQINVQLVGPDAVVLAFVTYHDSDATATPFAMFGTDIVKAQLTKAEGVTHRYQLPPRGPIASSAASTEMDPSLATKETRTARAVHAREQGDLAALARLDEHGQPRRGAHHGGVGALTVDHATFCKSGSTNSTVTVSYKGIANSKNNDYIGLWCPSNSKAEYVAYEWLGCKNGGKCSPDGSVVFSTSLAHAPAKETCEFRYCRDDDDFCGPAKPANFAAQSCPVAVGTGCPPPPMGRVYHMHFVKLSGLKPRAMYHYSVHSGAAGGVASAMFNFTAPYASPDVSEGKPTKIGIFGDMGVYTHNNMGNLLNDYQKGEIDVLLHMGDHAYNMGDKADARGDGYMNAYQKVLTQVPWVPVVGNHEAGDGDDFDRYFNQTWGHVLGEGERAASATQVDLSGRALHKKQPLRQHDATTQDQPENLRHL
eukprot:SAG22_NODE_3105_length_1938_cov_1.647635_1_plen_535_part_10